MFVVQILTISVLIPARFIRHARGWAANFGSKRFAQLYPDVDYHRAIERFVTRFRAACAVIAVIGLLLLAWLFSLTQRPDWARAVTRPTVTYFFVQLSPLFF